MLIFNSTLSPAKTYNFKSATNPEGYYLS
uniref:Uncharacterized protein n=1 Tax=Lepeophtheirus salmonis TaxID=72036 RepID=A0A0K2TM23_LEPSM